MDSSTRDFFEPRFGQDFSHVRLHTDTQAAESARAVNARAYTVGNHIVFGAGQAPSNAGEGRGLIAHELTHVVQQAGGVRPMLQRAETDTAVSCGGLSDTRSKIDQRVNAALSKARSNAADQPWRGHQAWAKMIVDSLYAQLGKGRASHPGRTQIEDWAESKLDPQKEVRQPAQSATKYRGVRNALWTGSIVRVLGATLKVSNVCIGTDKLGHFFQQGYEYFEIARRQKKGEAAAERYGLKTEILKFGLATTGVFSNADLEANRQGLAFYDNLAANPGMTFNIASYISGQWNEETNTNLYDPAIAPKVWANLITGSWGGSFTDADSQSDFPVKMKLRATPKGKVTGNYAFRNSSNQVVRGKIRGRFILRSHGILPKQASATKAVHGVGILFKWDESGHVGHGMWKSAGENLLQGTWGRGKSRGDAGLWWALKA